MTVAIVYASTHGHNGKIAAQIADIVAGSVHHQPRAPVCVRLGEPDGG